MSATPFLTIPIRRKQDVIRVRHRARQVALLLRFPAADQACIAAGTFAVACQALATLGKFHLCFQLDQNQLHVYARAVGGEMPNANRPVNRIAPASAPETLLRLAKPLLEPPPLAETDLAWLVHNGDKPGTGLFAEVVKQNEEVLILLHELHACQQQRRAEEPAKPNAA